MSKPVDNDFTANLALTLYENSHDKEFTDFKIKAGTKSITCHRSVICANSEYFRSLCKSGVKEAELDNAIVREEDGPLLMCLIEYMYLGATEITRRNVEWLVLAAKFVTLHQLTRKCEEFMLTNLSVDNLLSYHHIAKKIKLADLSRVCERLAKDQFHKVITTDWLLSLAVEELEDYLKADDLCVPNEDVVLDAVIRWIDVCGAPSSVKDNYIERLVPCVRLSRCTKAKLKDLSKNPGVPNHLQLKILQYLQHGLHEGITGARRAYPTSAAPAGTTITSGITTPASTVSVAGAKPKSGSAGANPKPGRAGATPKPGSTGAVSSSTAATYEEHVLIVGGVTTGPKVHSNVIFLDKPEGTILTTAPLCEDAYYVSVCALPDGLITSGGLNNTTNNSQSHVQKFSLKDSSWTDLPDMLTRRGLHGLVCINKQLFAVGGVLLENGKGKKHLASVSVLDLHRLAWTEYQPIDVAVEQPGVSAIDSDLFVFGGHDGEDDTTQAYRYDTCTGKRTCCQPMPKPCSPWNCTVAVGRFIFLLQHDASLFMQYDTTCDQWSELPCPLKQLSASSVVFHNGRLVVSGGYENDWKKPDNTVQSYDIDNKKWWVEKQTMPLPLCNHTVIVLKLAR